MWSKALKSLFDVLERWIWQREWHRANCKQHINHSTHLCWALAFATRAINEFQWFKANRASSSLRSYSKHNYDSLSSSPSSLTKEIICACFPNAQQSSVGSRKIGFTSSRIGAEGKKWNKIKAEKKYLKPARLSFFNFDSNKQQKSYKMILNFTLRFKCQTMCEDQWTFVFCFLYVSPKID